jgi:hypothetical protein
MNDTDTVNEAVETTNQTLSAPQRAVPYSPVAMSWNISQGSSAEGPLVVVQIATPEGDKVFFLHPSIAKQIGEAILTQSSLAESGPTDSQ